MIAPKATMRLSRRDFARIGAVTLAMIGLAPRMLGAQDAKNGAEPEWMRHIRAITGDKEPVEDRVTLDLPEVAENGNLVPFTIAVDYPMSGTDFIQALHVIGAGNPSPPIASFYFTPFSGAARVSSRMRLSDTQDVIALAQTSGGDFFIGRRRVEIVVPCCG